MRALAIIPARGGSKGIPGKNIRVLGGKPLLAYTVEAARVSALRGHDVADPREAAGLCAVAVHDDRLVVEGAAHEVR